MARLLVICCLTLILVAGSNAMQSATIIANDLRCENRKDPLGIGARQPNLSWTLKSSSQARSLVQSAYRIVVASKPSILAKNRGDLWDSGKVASRDQNNISYQGKQLGSSQICYWKVQIWGSGSQPTWSQPAHWEMGLLHKQDWVGKWINDGKPVPTRDEDFYSEDPAPIFRKEFVLKEHVKSARLSIAGLGYYEATINGVRVGDHVLEPGWTKVDKKVLYSVYDVTDLLKNKQACLGIMLGNGWYNPLPLKLFGSFNLRNQLAVGRPRVIAQLAIEYQDGSHETIATDQSWKVAAGPILRNNIYLGEIVDARKEPIGWDKPGFSDRSWSVPGIATEPIGELLAPVQPPIRITADWNAVKVTEPKPGVFIYDCGVNFAGWVRLRLDVVAGTKIRLRYGELLHKDGTLNPMTSVAGQIKGYRQGTKESVGGSGAPEIAWQEDIYIARGGGETYIPRFTFHGFRYVEITGISTALPFKSVTALKLNSDFDTVGSFECSNPLLNKIQDVCLRTFKSNVFSVQSDCPHRERLGYGGDIVATSEAFMSNFDMSGFYTKAVGDWSDSALKDGMFTDTAPFIGIQYCGPIWAMAHPLLTDQIVQYYGNTRLANQEYDAAKKWISLVEKQYPDGIVTDGLSDHESLVPTPSPELVTPMYFRSAMFMADLAQRLGHSQDHKEFSELAGRIRKAYISKFYDAHSGKVGPGTQASQSMALETQIIDDPERPKVLAYLLDDIRAHNDHLTTGILGTKFMLNVLSREGHADVAYRIATQKDFPSWGWMIKNDATTLWEHWEGSDNTYSNNHPMFGSISQWMMQWLGGIQPNVGATGFDQIVVSPQTPIGLDWVKSSYKSVRGKIVSNWAREGSRVKFTIEVPINSVALVTLSVKSIDTMKEGGRPLSSAKGVSGVRFANKCVNFTIGSGKYLFEGESR